MILKKAMLINDKTILKKTLNNRKFFSRSHFVSEEARKMRSF